MAGDEIKIGDTFFVPGMSKHFIPEIKRVTVTEVSWQMLPVIDRLTELVTVRFKNGTTAQVDGISLRHNRYEGG